jgi:putative component of toxin-antitoxin plasmid stabilization module
LLEQARGRAHIAQVQSVGDGVEELRIGDEFGIGLVFVWGFVVRIIVVVIIFIVIFGIFFV